MPSNHVVEISVSVSSLGVTGCRETREMVDSGWVGLGRGAGIEIFLLI